ncbi:hypothetical protein [Streptomyces sudanensis]|uniref:hypothetical protein n=1 Tax=Streptomyces sudanensis TaxID=436397 RepID=UPI0027E43E9B|nr:hypothetical protein [Streptomyces sudanensis]
MVKSESVKFPRSSVKCPAAMLIGVGLPRADAVAVGTDDAGHLRELIKALAYEVDENTVREYRRLLKSRQAD